LPDRYQAGILLLPAVKRLLGNINAANQLTYCSNIVAGYILVEPIT
jgi:hypothetical protein